MSWMRSSCSAACRLSARMMSARRRQLKRHQHLLHGRDRRRRGGGGAGGRACGVRAGGANRCGTRHQEAFLSSRAATSYTHLRAHATPEHLVCRLLLEKTKKKKTKNKQLLEIKTIQKKHQKIKNLI